MPGLNASAGLLALAGLTLFSLFEDDETERVRQASTIGDIEAGAELIERAGCGTCHMIPGIDGADGLVGPPLIHWSRRTYIAGLLRNTPSNMIAWLMAPQDIVPNNAMPDLGLNEEQARDITAYLYTID